MKNLKEEDFLSGKINLHIHSNCSDGKADFYNIVQSAKNKGYKLISITDHNTIEGYKTVKDEILMSGVEFDCWFCGVFIHLLAYNFDINNPEIAQFMAKTKQETEGDLVRLFSRRNVPELIQAIHNAGGIAVLAHPACYWAINIEHFIKKLISVGLDGIEVYYPYPGFRKIVKFHTASKIKKIADKYPQLIKTGGTDFHGKIF